MRTELKLEEGKIYKRSDNLRARKIIKIATAKEWEINDSNEEYLRWEYIPHDVNEKGSLCLLRTFKKWASSEITEDEAHKLSGLLRCASCNNIILSSDNDTLVLGNRRFWFCRYKNCQNTWKQKHTLSHKAFSEFQIVSYEAFLTPEEQTPIETSDNIQIIIKTEISSLNCYTKRDLDLCYNPKLDKFKIFYNGPWLGEVGFTEDDEREPTFINNLEELRAAIKESL